MKLPIDTGSVKFAAAGPAKPVPDYETCVMDGHVHIWSHCSSRESAGRA